LSLAGGQVDLVVNRGGGHDMPCPYRVGVPKSNVSKVLKVLKVLNFWETGRSRFFALVGLNMSH
jgi:hypothetical protein